MRLPLQYDDASMRVSDTMRQALPITEALSSVEALRASGAQGFFDLPSAEKIAAALSEKARALRRRGFRQLLVIGIGGSDLGSRALIQALGNRRRGLDVWFLGTPDPDVVARFAKKGRGWKSTAIYVVSKSGGTLETLALFLAAREALIKSVGAKRHAAHVFVTTETAGSNPLLSLAQAEGYEVLAHPANVGGRYSVLSVVGLFPAACAGIDIGKILAGARWAEMDARERGAESIAARFAINQIASLRAGRPIHVLMPYAQALEPFGRWYRQLWAESLGKDGKGPTPVAAIGPIDQHSQMQLYQAGPDDKTVTLIETERFAAKAKVPRVPMAPQAIARLAGLSFTDIMHAERAGTAQALAEDGKPIGTFFIPEISPESVGALLQTFMRATAFAGSLLGVNAFDQPGVEAGKKAARKSLGLE